MSGFLIDVGLYASVMSSGIDGLFVEVVDIGGGNPRYHRRRVNVGCLVVRVSKGRIGANVRSSATSNNINKWYSL